MTEDQQKELGKTLWAIADQLRGVMNADDFRDYMLSFLFLRYLSDNYDTAVKDELGADYPVLPPKPQADNLQVDNLQDARNITALQIWYDKNPQDVVSFEDLMRRRMHYIIKPEHLWNNIAEMARTQDEELLKTLQAGFKYIENESFESSFQGLFSEINLGSEKLGKTYTTAMNNYARLSPRLMPNCRNFLLILTRWVMPMNI